MATNTNTELTSRQKSTKKRYERLKSDTPEGYPVPSTRLRFPIIPKEIEYLDIIDRKVTVKSYKTEIAGISWRAVNEKLFEDGIPAGKYSYAMKFFKNSFIYRGFIKSVNAKGDRTVNPEENNNLKVIRQTIDSLKDSLKTGQPLGIEYIMAATDKAHQSELSIYKMEIAQLKEKIIELKQEVNLQDAELDKAEAIINQLKEQASSGDIQKTLLTLVNQFVKPSPELIKRKDS